MASKKTDFAEVILDAIRRKTAADDAVLREARNRRDCVTAAGRGFPGALRSFNSGSVAHGTVTDPVSDADCGIVLDRRRYPYLGPDGGGIGPLDIVDEVAAFVMDIVLEHYPDATCGLTKRAILIRFNEPMDDEDPTVDLIVALNRKAADGLWIPNREDEDWDASDPIEHTELLVADPKNLRVHRARAIRLGKVCIKGDEDKAVISSFNLEALALIYVTEIRPMGETLAQLFLRGAADIARRDTPDPAGVSDPIKLPDQITRETAVRRLRFFGGCFERAGAHSDDRDIVLESVAAAFPDGVLDAPKSPKQSIAFSLRNGNGHPGVPAAFGVGAVGLKTPRSFGAH
jgi:hypothetical protein